MKRICYEAGRIIYWLLCLFLIGNILLCVTGIRPYAVISGSMEPAIATGSVSWVWFFRGTDHLQEKDILAFERSDGEIVLHRIVKITEEGIVTKGDANDTVDPAMVKEQQIRGKVLFSIPYIGKLFHKTE